MHPTSMTRGILRTAIVGATVACVLMLAVPAFAASGWKAAASGTTGDLAGVAAPTAGLRWAVGAGGVIVASADGGTTWARRPRARPATCTPSRSPTRHTAGQWARWRDRRDDRRRRDVGAPDSGTTADLNGVASPTPRMAGRSARRRDRRHHRRRLHLDRADVRHHRRPDRRLVGRRDPRMGSRRRRRGPRDDRRPRLGDADVGPTQTFTPSPRRTRRTQSPSAPPAPS